MHDDIPDVPPTDAVPTERPRLAAAPLVGAALSGFVIGIILTLIVTGTIGAGHPTPAIATLPPPSPVAQSQMFQRTWHIVNLSLGPAAPPQKGPRLKAITLQPVVHESNRPVPERFRTVVIRFELYDHPLGRSWRLKAAKADVFAVMKALYTSRLPIYDVEMQGVFPIRVGKSLKTRRVLLAYIPYSLAKTIPWRHWGREHEARLWNVLPYKFVNSSFA
jgi:hypothetical protein